MVLIGAGFKRCRGFPRRPRRARLCADMCNQISQIDTLPQDAEGLRALLLTVLAERDGIAAAHDEVAARRDVLAEQNVTLAEENAVLAARLSRSRRHRGWSKAGCRPRRWWRMFWCHALPIIYRSTARRRFARARVW